MSHSRTLPYQSILRLLRVPNPVTSITIPSRQDRMTSPWVSTKAEASSDGSTDFVPDSDPSGWDLFQQDTTSVSVSVASLPTRTKLTSDDRLTDLESTGYHNKHISARGGSDADVGRVGPVTSEAGYQEGCPVCFRQWNSQLYSLYLLSFCRKS